MSSESLKEENAPWRVKNFQYGSGVVGLHQEIEQFYQYILPTPTEHAMRLKVVQRIEATVHSIWPKARIEIFGSYRTGLFLPKSDIDLVIFGLWEEIPLRTLEKVLVANAVTEQTSVQVVDTAVVPLVRIIDREAKIKVDISFNEEMGVRSAELVKKYKQAYPLLPKLVLVVKQFLVQRDLNEVFTGGISSYAIILLCISFLQLHPLQLEYETANLGVILLEFFELYGRKFHYMDVGISICNGGHYFKRNRINKRRLPVLCIENPLEPGIYIGLNSYNTERVKSAFQYAHSVLANAVHPLQEHAEKREECSILARVIKINKDVLDYREYCRKNFAHLVSPTRGANTAK